MVFEIALILLQFQIQHEFAKLYVLIINTKLSRHWVVEWFSTSWRMWYSQCWNNTPKIVSSKMIFLTVLLRKIYLQFDIKVHMIIKSKGVILFLLIISLFYLLAKSKISKSLLHCFPFFFSRLNYFSNWLIQIHFKEKEKQLLCMHYVPQIIWATTKQELENSELDKSICTNSLKYIDQKYYFDPSKSVGKCKRNHLAYNWLPRRKCEVCLRLLWLAGYTTTKLKFALYGTVRKRVFLNHAFQVVYLYRISYVQKYFLQRCYISNLSKFWRGACANTPSSQEPTSTCFSSYRSIKGCFSNSRYLGRLVTSFVKLKGANKSNQLNKFIQIVIVVDYLKAWIWGGKLARKGNIGDRLFTEIKPCCMGWIQGWVTIWELFFLGT